MALLLPPAELQFCDANGNPYAGGTLATYIPGTTTPATTWTNAGETVANTNPIVLDAAGRCILYGNGVYRTILTDVFSNLIFDQLTSSAISDAMQPVALSSTLTAARTAMGIDAEIATAIAAYAAGTPVNRVAIALNTTWYVDGTLGNDAHSGLASGAGAFATVQHALTILATLYDGRGFGGTISVASGTFNVGAGLVADGPFVGFSSVVLACSATKSSVILQATGSTLTVQHGAILYINGGFELDCSVAGNNVLQALFGGQCYLAGPVTFGPIPGAAILYATRFGYIEIDADIWINGGTSGNLIQASHSGNVRHTVGAIIHFNANHNFTDCTLYALLGDITITASANFSIGAWAITGMQYRASENGIIQWALDTGGNSIPGSVIGLEELGGRYDYGNSPLETASGSFTVNMATIGTGSVTITPGFTPGVVDFICTAGAASPAIAGTGFATLNAGGAIGQPAISGNYSMAGGTQGAQPSATTCLQYFTGASIGVAGVANTPLVNGLTIAFVTFGAATGTLTVYWKARRGI